MPKPLVKKQKLAPGQERSITVSIKSLRNPPLDITLSSQLPNTSILDLKSVVSSQTSIPVEKIKMLHKKKPVADSKVLKNLVGDEDMKVEFSIMVMGGSASVKEAEALVTQGVGVADVLGTEEFWQDLKGYLSQRLRNEEHGEKLVEVFKKAWDSNRR